jgi:hypothetical protein
VLTKLSSVGKVVQGRANDPFLLPALRWEVVQLAVHQILEPNSGILDTRFS